MLDTNHVKGYKKFVMLKKKNVLKFILGLKIRQLRARRELSLKELADRTDLSASYLNEIENGKKYPKIEKLAALAEGLNVGLEELVSFKTGRNLHPLLKFLEGDVVGKVPLELVGLNESDVVDLMGKDPEKFASFVLTVLQLSRSFDMQLEDLYDASLKSYIEVNDNYFPELEKLSKKIKTEAGLSQIAADYDQLAEYLKQKFEVNIDDVSLINHPQLEDVNHFYKTGPVKTLFLNSRLHNTQKKFYIAKIIGRQLLEETRNEQHPGALAERLLDFKSSYFSNAFLIDEKLFSKDLKQLFNKNEFDENHFTKLLDTYQVSPELMFHRLTQILPSAFKIREIFFLGMSLNLTTGRASMNKELHLSQLHRPHGVRMNETYCQRWVALRSMERFKGRASEDKSAPKFVLGQRSKVEDGNEYFSISLARESCLRPEIVQSLTIGFLINDELKNVVKFLDDPNLKKESIGQTCERCGVESCNERKAEPSIYLQLQSKKNLQALLEKI